MPADEDLMADVRCKNAASFEALFERYNRLVFGIALRMLGARVAAEDATQAVFLKVWHAPELFRGGSLSAWLVRVTRNHCLDHLRASRPTYSLDSVAGLADDTPVEDVVFMDVDARHVRKSLEELPKEQRDAIEMGFFSGLTHQEIARSTGTPLGTVKTRIRAGLHELRARLDGAINR
ncbi:MAG TPA: sigma-70 family RNA polymerase sigma factor [Candidatus Acidoferrales bacterium]|nr:sigma-70 family RNA polymerase sigma factor [Candidatus Acidoferrales bacterium]